jgi:hypothetical protein
MPRVRRVTTAAKANFRGLESDFRGASWAGSGKAVSESKGNFMLGMGAMLMASDGATNEIYASRFLTIKHQSKHRTRKNMNARGVGFGPGAERTEILVGAESSDAGVWC